MAKTSVYSWRLSPQTKDALEREARREGLSLAELLDRVAREWLEARERTMIHADAESGRLRAAAMRRFGAFDSGETDSSERVRALVRKRLAARRAP